MPVPAPFVVLILSEYASLGGVMLALRAGEDGPDKTCWREAACGTVSFHDAEGERLKTLYLARLRGWTWRFSRTASSAWATEPETSARRWLAAGCLPVVAAVPEVGSAGASRHRSWYTLLPPGAS